MTDAGSADRLVIFGITGDLAKVMTFHSLYRLEQRGLLHVVLDVSGRVSIPGSPERMLPPPPSAQDTDSYRRSLRWLEMVLDALAQAGRAAPASASD